MGVFDFLIPGFILEKSMSVMFPVSWHRTFNYLWLAQVSLAFLWCMRAGRWVPAWNGSFGPWPFRQLIFMMITHTCFYVVELYVTRMWQDFTQMAIHHAVAIIVFTGVILEPNSLSVVCLFPFLCHAIYWVHGAVSDPILATYNFLMLICGSIGLHNNLALGPVDRPITHMLPVSVLIICWDNYFTYCMSYNGSACLRDDDRDKRVAQFSRHATALFALNILLVYAMAMFSRKRWAALGIRPWFAKPIVLGEDDNDTQKAPSSSSLATNLAKQAPAAAHGIFDTVMSYFPRSLMLRRHGTGPGGAHSRVPTDDLEAHISMTEIGGGKTTTIAVDKREE